MKYASSESEEEMEQAQIRKKEFVSLKFIRQSFAFYSSLKEKNKKKNFSIDMKLKWKQRTEKKFSWEFSFLSSSLDRVYAVIEGDSVREWMWWNVGFNWVEM